ncbi:MAG: DUF3131 domain-containing protein, partial [Candidatus Omnitrophica bacterium]|nr:DUF3131 domain-containing protein [Candidatus Omnitrophota bacterium]
TVNPEDISNQICRNINARLVSNGWFREGMPYLLAHGVCNLEKMNSVEPCYLGCGFVLPKRWLKIDGSTDFKKIWQDIKYFICRIKESFFMPNFAFVGLSNEDSIFGRVYLEKQSFYTQSKNNALFIKIGDSRRRVPAVNPVEAIRKTKIEPKEDPIPGQGKKEKQQQGEIIISGGTVPGEPSGFVSYNKYGELVYLGSGNSTGLLREKRPATEGEEISAVAIESREEDNSLSFSLANLRNFVDHLRVNQFKGINVGMWQIRLAITDDLYKALNLGPYESIGSFNCTTEEISYCGRIRGPDGDISYASLSNLLLGKYNQTDILDLIHTIKTHEQTHQVNPAERNENKIFLAQAQNEAKLATVGKGATGSGKLFYRSGRDYFSSRKGLGEILRSLGGIGKNYKIRKTFKPIARKTWNGLAGFTGGKYPALPPNSVTADLKSGINRGIEIFIDKVEYKGAAYEIDRRTSPTNIGCYLMAVVYARLLGFIDNGEAQERIGATLSAVEGLKNYQGLLYNWYDTRNGMPLMDCAKQLPFISMVDNSNLAAALMGVELFFPYYQERIKQFTESMRFSRFFDERRGLFYGGGWVSTKNSQESVTLDETFHYDFLASEAMLLYIVAILLGEMDVKYWKNLACRTEEKPLPEGMCYVPFDGTMFAMTVPWLYLDIAQWPLKMKNSIKRFIEFQIERGKKERKPWGWSECGFMEWNCYTYKTVRGAYEADANPGRDNLSGPAAPYASILALVLKEMAPQVYTNVFSLMKRGVCGEFGFYESEKANVYFAHHQGWIIAAMAEYILGGTLPGRFHKMSYNQEGVLERVLNTSEYVSLQLSKAPDKDEVAKKFSADRSAQGSSAKKVDAAIERFGGIEEILKKEIKDIFTTPKIVLGIDKA